MLLSEVIVETTLSQADALPGKKLAGRTEARASGHESGITHKREFLPWGSNPAMVARRAPAKVATTRRSSYAWNLPFGLLCLGSATVRAEIRAFLKPLAGKLLSRSLLLVAELSPKLRGTVKCEAQNSSFDNVRARSAGAANRVCSQLGELRRGASSTERLSSHSEGVRCIVLNRPGP
jgi:hypothetical protein